MKWSKYFAFAGLAITVSADVLDLGDLDQYNSKLDTDPGVGDNAVWVSGKDGDGYNIVLSSDINDKVQSVLQGCGQADDKCFHDIRAVIDSADLEVDKQLDRRGFGSLISKTFKRIGYIYDFMVAALLADWYLKHAQPPRLGQYIPQAKASEAPVLATATNVVVSAAGSPVVTITPTPDATKLEGPSTPSVTPVTADGNGLSKGDLVACLDKDLASRIDEIMHRATDCDDGRSFNSKRRSRKRGDPNYGAAICGAEAAALQASPGGPFNDLLLLDMEQLSFGFADAAGAAARAASVVVDFVKDYAPLLAIDPSTAEQLGNYLFALAIDTLIDNNAIGQNNRIPSSLITTSTATSTKSGCPDPTASPLLCGDDGQDCNVKLPDKMGDQPVCNDGDHKDCECTAPSDTYVDNASNDEQNFMIYIADLFTKVQPAVATKPQCPFDTLSDIPSNVFGSDQNNVYHHFCDGWDKSKESKMTVDAAGNDRNPPSRRLRRTPPANPDTYKHYDFELSYKPADGGTVCTQDCMSAFGTITSACGNAGSVNVAMAPSGSYDIGCGTFAYNIVKQPVVPQTLQDRQCFGADDFGPHADIQGGTQAQYTSYVCAGTALKTIKRGDPSTFITWSPGASDPPYQYNIYWKDGCVLDDGGPDEVYPANPLGLSDPGYTYCQNLLVEDYTKCNNGGVGGSIQAGCVVYEFKAQKK